MALPKSAWLLAVIASALSVLADTSYQVETSPADSPLVWQSNLAMTMRVSASSSDATTQVFTVVPLAVIPGLNSSSNGVSFSGSLVKATTTNYVSIASSSDIAFLSCDSLNNSYIDANRMLNALIANLPVAIVLYSQTENTCKIETSSELPYQAIFSMIHPSEATQALNLTSSSSGAAQAVIVSNYTNTGNANSDSPGGSNSAIAMSVLYSITGIITLLFLVIIATGAIRAHRYPERYGPRGAYGGRPRQSRAKGIARAVLETIPIVKFGDNTPAKPDPSMELESASGSSQSNPGSGSVHDLPAQPHHLSAIPEDAATRPKDNNDTVNRNADGQASSTDDGETAGPGVANSNTADADEHLGCSICTEDFTVGEDVRVLPCDHKFHPACIDPWLVNVSGTCPLCRLDLHPPVAETDETASGEGSMHLPPPLEAEDTSVAGAETATTSHHRLHAPRLFDISRLRHASAEERLEVLRQYRSENRGAAAAGTGDVESEHGHSATLTRRLRERFRIRTRVLSPASESRAEL